MTSTPHRTPSEHHRHRSLFFQDLSSPSPSPFRLSSPSSSSPYNNPSPPPPPILSLHSLPSPSPSPPLPFLSSPSPSPLKSPLTFSSPDKDVVGNSPVRAGSPVEGLVRPTVGDGALMTLPAPREVVRPERSREPQTVWELDEEVWVTVYGFAPSDTNLVLREFEKCGEILRWVPGPKEANWMHILYQSRFDAQKALAKHGAQLNNLLIVGVKRVDPLQHRFLNESLSETPSPLPLADISPRTNGAQSGTALIPFNLRSGTGNNNNGGMTERNEGLGAVASPSKSVLSRVLDVMFGL